MWDFSWSAVGQLALLVLVVAQGIHLELRIRRLERKKR